MNETAINWTEYTWNPASGCDKVSEGCKHCYAFTLAERKRGTLAFPNGFDLTIRPHKLVEPYKIKAPSLIFVNSMSDLFWERIPDDYRDKIVDVIEATPQHQYQVLTKRANRLLEYSKRRKLPKNFWAGVTIENARNAFRLDILRKVNTPIRFVSVEPLLSDWKPDFTDIQWVIVGGESGSHLNNMDVCKQRGLSMPAFGKWMPRPDRKDWVRHVRDACLISGAAFWFKQWGGPTPHSAGRNLDGETWDEKPTFGQVQAPLRPTALGQLPLLEGRSPSRQKNAPTSPQQLTLF